MLGKPSERLKRGVILLQHFFQLFSYFVSSLASFGFLCGKGMGLLFSVRKFYFRFVGRVVADRGLIER